MPRTFLSTPRRCVAPARVFAALGLALLLGACGETSQPADSQVVATVGDTELSVHQVNFLLQRQRGVAPEQREAAGRQVLERLIDQELALQQAMRLELDRDPRIVQALDAARRDILARAYIERVAAGVPTPEAAQVRSYYQSKPVLFAERRIYTFREYAVNATAEQVVALQERMKGAKSVLQVIDWARGQKMPMNDSLQTLPAEALPLGLIDRLAAMRPGQALVLPMAQGLNIVVLEQSQVAAVDEEQARAPIEQFLRNDERRKTIESDIKALRESIPITYVGAFAPQPGDAASAVAPAEAASAASAEPAGPAASATGLDLSKGLSALN